MTKLTIQLNSILMVGAARLASSLKPPTPATKQFTDTRKGIGASIHNSLTKLCVVTKSSQLINKRETQRREQVTTELVRMR